MKKRRSLKIQRMYQVGDYTVTETLRGGWKVRGASEKTLGRWFSLNQVGLNLWEVSRGDSGNGCSNGRIRRRFEALSLPNAVELAEELVFGVVTIPEDGSQTVWDVLSLWMESRKRTASKVTLDQYQAYCEEFLSWLESIHLSLWKDLKPEHLDLFVDHCLNRKKPYGRNTIRLRLVPVRGASKWAARKWGLKDFAAGFRLEGIAKPKKSGGHWPLAHIAAFLVWLRDQPGGWSVLPGFALQGLCGLRVLEVLRLRWGDVDFRGGLITIRDAKNESSNREIPIPALVRRILEQAFEKSASEMVISEIKGKNQVSTYSRRWIVLSQKWKTGTVRMPLKDLRNSLLTESNLRGWYSMALEMYVGHTVPHAVLDITARHYLAGNRGQMRQVFRRQVVEKIDESVARWAQFRRRSGDEGKVIPLRAVR